MQWLQPRCGITRNCCEPSNSTGDSRLLTPRGQGLQGIRAGLIGLGWIRGQGSHPTAQGGRFRCLLGAACSAWGSTGRTWAQGTSQSQPSALSSERRFSLNIPTEGELGSKPYKHPWADGVGGGQSELGCWACLAKWGPQGLGTLSLVDRGHLWNSLAFLGMLRVSMPGLGQLPIIPSSWSH